jgi:DNA helicase-2/ATP-dependent DNA helicase PcrA
MRERIARLLGEDAVKGLVMGTFHSLGVRFLRQNPGIVADRLGLMPNFVIYDDTDQISTVKQAIISIGMDPKRLAPRRMLSRISAAKALLVDPDEFANQVETYDEEVVLRVYREYQRLLDKANAVDFDDLLVLPLKLFDAAPALLERYQQRYRYILVDEYQDTNRVQYVLVSALAARHRNLFVVGDPDQSIYAWRQADIRNILEFEREFPDATQIHLEVNYRSTRHIVAAADRVIRENTQRIDRKLRTDNDEGAKVSVRELSDQHHEAHFIVDEIRRLVSASGYSGDDIAVMYRTTAQSRVLEEAFRAAEFAYRIVGGVRFYDRKEVKDVLAVLRLLYNPADTVSLERVLENLPIGRGIGPKAMEVMDAWAAVNRRPTLDAFLALVAEQPNAQDAPPPALTGTALTAARRVGAIFADLRRKTGDLPLEDLFDAIVDQTGYQASFDTESEEEMQRWANVLELRSDLGRYSLVAPEEALPTYLEQVALIADVDSMDDDSRGKVTLITLHSAKGLEYPVVFIAGVEEGLLPISRAVEAEWSDPMPLEEERRLFYVGITRAKQLLYVTYAGFRQLYGRTQPAAASRFLASLPAEHVTARVRQQATPRRGQTSLLDRARQDTRSGSGSSSSSASSYSWSANADPAAPAAPPPPSVVYEKGQRVFHPKFGEGVIANVVTRSGDQDLTIEFARHGRKTVQASFANLDVIAD